MASRPRHQPGLPHGFMQHHREGMAGSSGCPPLGPPETEADHHNHTADDAGEQVCVDHETASTPFVLALRAAGAAC